VKRSAVLTIIVGGLVLAQAWTRTFDGGYSGYDAASAVAVTPSDDIVVGGSIGKPGHVDCPAVSKWASSGALVWFKTYEPYPGFDGYVTDIGVTKNGCVFAACACRDSSNVWTTIVLKLAPDGSMQKHVHFSDPAHLYDYPTDLELDRSQNCLVAMASDVSSLNGVTRVMKLDSAGNVQWTSVYDHWGRHNDPAALAVDSAGNSYVVGEAITSWSNAATLAKFSPQGDTCWTTTYDPEGENTYFRDVVVHGDSLYVVGDISHGTPRLLVAAYDAVTGDTFWSREMAIGAGVGISAIDTLGIFGCGYAADSLTAEDFKVFRCGSNGSPKWVARYDGPGHDYDVPYDIGVSPQGLVYVVGASGGGATSTDCATLSYEPTGSLRWVARFTGDGSPSYDQGSRLCLDSRGNVIVAGFATMASTGKDILLIKYPPTGPGVTEDEREVASRERTITARPTVASTATEFVLTGLERPDVIRIVDPSGRVVKRITPTRAGSTRFTARWDLSDQTGRRVPNGLYLVIVMWAGHVGTTHVVVQH